MDTQMNTKRILIFLSIAFGVPWTATLVIYLTIGANDLGKALGLANTALILTPWLANIITRLVTREGWGHLMLRPNFRRGWRFYLAAWLLPLLAVVVGGGIFILLFPQTFGLNLKVAELYLPGTFHSNSFWPGLLFAALKAMAIGLVINGLVSIIEEFGWRAYLLPKLIEHIAGPAATPKAALLTGVIWGVWHWPLLFMGMGLDPTIPILQPLVYLVSTCALSVLLCWVTLRSGSVWPASIGHGTVNATTVLPMILQTSPANPLLGPGPAGLVSGLGYFTLALVLLLSRRAFPGDEKQAGAEITQAAAITHPG